jgi:glycosyltransferase involved in cell wall biosynthesis
MMKIVIYDPLYANIGHFYRYNIFLVEILSSLDEVASIEIIGSDSKLKNLSDISDKVTVTPIEQVEDIQILSLKAKGAQKIFLAFDLFKQYMRVIKYLNRSAKDTIILFPSQGQLPFWLAAKFLKRKYYVSAISTRWFFSSTIFQQFLKSLFVSFLKKSELCLFTEVIYKNNAEKLGILKTLVMPDRYLKKGEALLKQGDGNKKIRLTTLGTISNDKNPIKFINALSAIDKDILSTIEYYIAGKVIDDCKIELEKAIRGQDWINFEDNYISAEKYEELIAGTDFLVIPYPTEYTKYLTSGVMWDCFERKKAIICPESELFGYYINNYQIGYLYNEQKMGELFKSIIAQKTSFFKQLNDNYQLLTSDFSKQKLTDDFEKALTGRNK